jgi:hypothetical protein
MYSQFRVQNFRGFKDLELKDLARVNLIAGKNNVGKTSLLESILIHAGRYNTAYSRMENVIDRRVIYRADERFGDMQKWNLLFNNFDTNIPIIFSGDGLDNQKRLPGFEDVLTLSVIHIDELNTDEIDARAFSRYVRDDNAYETVMQNMELLVFKREGVKTFYIGKYNDSVMLPLSFPTFAPVVVVNSRSQVSNEDNSRRFSKLKIERKIDILVNSLKIIEPRLGNIDLLSDGIYGDVRGMHQLVPLSSMGEGIGRIASLVLAISEAETGVVAVDEIENGLHYSIQADVWRAIARAAELFNVQIFATTHSFEMIRAAQEAFQEMGEHAFRFYRLDREENDDIKAVKYSPKTMSAAISMNFEVRG